MSACSTPASMFRKRFGIKQNVTTLPYKQRKCSYNCVNLQKKKQANIKTLMFDSDQATGQQTNCVNFKQCQTAAEA